MKEIDDGRIHRDVSRLTVLRVSDDDEARVEVQIVPLQAPDLAGAHPGMERHSYYRSEVGRDPGLHEQVALLARQIPQPRIILGQEPDALHRALVQKFPIDSAVEHVPEPAHDPVDRGGLARLALPGLPVLELRPRDLADGPATKFADPELNPVALGVDRLQQGCATLHVSLGEFRERNSADVTVERLFSVVQLPGCSDHIPSSFLLESFRPPIGPQG